MDVDGIWESPQEWSPCTWYGVGDRVLGKNGRYHRCIKDGQSAWGSSVYDEPSWPEMDGEQILDGSVRWECEGFPIPPLVKLERNLIAAKKIADAELKAELPELIEEREV